MKLYLKTLFTASALSMIASSAFAQSPDCTKGYKLIINDKMEVTDVKVPEGCPGISRNMLSPGAGRACPHGNVRVEPRPVSHGGAKMAMDKEQRHRGDKRWHVVCDWSVASSAGK